VKGKKTKGSLAWEGKLFKKRGYRKINFSLRAFHRENKLFFGGGIRNATKISGNIVEWVDMLDGGNVNCGGKV